MSEDWTYRIVDGEVVHEEEFEDHEEDYRLFMTGILMFTLACGLVIAGSVLEMQAINAMAVVVVVLGIVLTAVGFIGRD